MIGGAVAGFLGLRGLRSLRHRNYRLFFVGQLVSVTGTRMQVIAQSWLVLELTGDPFLLGVVVAAQFGPILLLGLFGGLIADGLPKRRTLIVTQGLEMVLALVLFGLTITGEVTVWHVIVLAAALGLVNAIDTPTRQSFAIEMVGKNDVANAVALNVSTFNTARVLGPAIAGLVIASIGIPAVFLINGLSYLAVITALLIMRTDALQSSPSIARPAGIREVLENLVEGLGYVWHAPLLLLVVVLLGVVSIFGINFVVLGPPLARDILHADVSGYGLLMSAFGAGALVSAVGIAMFGSRPATMAVAAMSLGVCLIALSSSSWLPLSLVLMALAGFGVVGTGATGNMTLQLGAPDHLRGRVISVYVVVFDGTAPIGGLITGAIASSAGVATALWIGGGVCAIAGVVAAVCLSLIGRSPATSTGPRGQAVVPSQRATVSSNMARDPADRPGQPFP